MTTDTKTETPIETVPVDAEPVALAPARVPYTLDELAARKREAIEIVTAKYEMLKGVRNWALRALWPQDLVLFRSPDGLVTAFLEDAGCDRVRPYFGIEIRDVSVPVKTVSPADPNAYYYTVTASGVCKLTGEILEPIEGGRSSTEEFVKHVTDPLQKDLLVRKAARASADGIVVRTLAGLQSIAEEELTAAWTGTTKRVDQCRKGRGYGTTTERLGGVRESDPNVPPPVCPHCKATAKYRPARGNRSAFYGCPNWEKHPQQKFTVDAEEWVAQQSKNKTAAPPPSDETLFGDREPGQEG